jgi:hypothetical protein
LLAKPYRFAVVSALFLNYCELLETIVSRNITVDFKRAGGLFGYGYLLAATLDSHIHREVIWAPLKIAPTPALRYH